MDIYDEPIDPQSCPLSADIVESDVDLYWRVALTMYCEIERANAAGDPPVFILPVGPVYQYRRFVSLCRMRPLDLSGLSCFFMDEYLDERGRLIDPAHPLSFRGFIQRELLDPMPGAMKLDPSRVRFPDPGNPAAYDRALEDLGGAALCVAGVGINGHVAFNEPPEPGESVAMGEFLSLGTRVVRLSRETITINSNTALRGAFDRIPRQAVSIGLRQIMGSRSILVCLNRPWQGAVVRRLLFGPETPAFPASLLRRHGNLRLLMTAEVAAKPEFALR